MKKTLILALILVATAGAQDGGKRSVEQPLKDGIAPRTEKFHFAAGGIDWHQGLESVLNQGRPILLFQLLGNFDDTYC